MTKPGECCQTDFSSGYETTWPANRATIRPRAQRGGIHQALACARAVELHVKLYDGETSKQGDRWWLELTVDSATTSKPQEPS